jgi:predicted glycoside hydrolase/deacetylase ChbG (UPF0249 family)
MTNTPSESDIDCRRSNTEYCHDVRDSANHGTEPSTATRRGALIVNADDWGRDRENTDRTLDCVSRGTVSSVSAMVFMEDSERAASIARAEGVDAGLHLNFTTPFSTKDCPSKLITCQGEIARCLLANRIAQVLFHPALMNSFEYVVSAQLDEFYRIYGEAPKRLDGHHHMHLCSNVLFARLLPAGTVVRRNFTFQPGEKVWFNRLYRQLVDRQLARRHHTTDLFFSLIPFDPPERLLRIFKLTEAFTVEVETHPVRLEEYEFLMGDEILHLSENLKSMVLRNTRTKSVHEYDRLAP